MRGDTDFSEEAYAQDLGAALECCELEWDRMGDATGVRSRYEQALKADSEAISRSAH